MKVKGYYCGRVYKTLGEKWLARAKQSGVDAELVEYPDRQKWGLNVWGRSLAFAEDYLKDPTRPLMRTDVDCEIRGSLDELDDGETLKVRVFETPGTTGIRELGGTMYLPAGREEFARVLADVARKAIAGEPPFCYFHTEEDIIQYSLGMAGEPWTALPREFCWIEKHDGPATPDCKIVHILASQAYPNPTVRKALPATRKVHVMLPCWGDGRHMPEVMASLGAQTYRNFSLTAHFDGPPYCGLDAIRKFTEENQDIPVRVQFSPVNRGTANALNRTIDFGMGSEYVTWMANDDIRHPDWLEVLVQQMDTHPAWVGCFSAYARDTGVMTDAGWRSSAWCEHTVDWERHRLIDDVNCPCGPSFLWRAKPARACLPHRGVTAHDYDFWLRLEELGPIGYVPKSLATYRVHDQRCTVVKRDQYDAKHWQQEARKRRGIK
jgi:hypothetical protein